MQQQPLGLSIPQHFDYGDWVRHPGVEQAGNRLALWLVQGGRLWLRSDGVAGKTHLLEALQQEHPRMGMIRVDRKPEGSALHMVEQWVRQLEGTAFWAADVEAGPLPHAVGIALFHWLERARDLNRPVLLSWRCAQSELAPPELRSRVNALEQVEMSEPESDTELLAVLQSVAQSKQWLVPDGALEAMLQMLPRKLDSLLKAFRYLDEMHAVGNTKRLTRTWVVEQLDRLKSAQAPT